MVDDLKDTIASKRTALAPLVTSLRQLRAEAQSIESNYTEKKSVYEKMAKDYENNKAQLEKEVNHLKLCMYVSIDLCAYLYLYLCLYLYLYLYLSIYLFIYYIYIYTQYVDAIVEKYYFVDT